MYALNIDVLLEEGKGVGWWWMITSFLQLRLNKKSWLFLTLGFFCLLLEFWRNYIQNQLFSHPSFPQTPPWITSRYPGGTRSALHLHLPPNPPTPRCPPKKTEVKGNPWIICRVYIWHQSGGPGWRGVFVGPTQSFWAKAMFIRTGKFGFGSVFFWGGKDFTWGKFGPKTHLCLFELPSLQMNWTGRFLLGLSGIFDAFEYLFFPLNLGEILNSWFGIVFDLVWDLDVINLVAAKLHFCISYIPAQADMNMMKRCRTALSWTFSVSPPEEVWKPVYWRFSRTKLAVTFIHYIVCHWNRWLVFIAFPLLFIRSKKPAIESSFHAPTFFNNAESKRWWVKVPQFLIQNSP